MRRITIILCLLLMTTCAIAQGGLTGSVVDSTSGNGLAKATVMLLRGGKTIKFVRTDDKGRFSFDVAAQQGDELQAILMGYGKHCQAVGKDNTIRLSQKTFQLKEVKVQGPPVTQRKDTIVYDLTKFASDRDNSLKDVLSKLPGVDVEKNGEIKYNGKAISRFTVEGLDLSKGQYNKLTENIRAKDVKKAEVMEHDQPIKALRNRVFTDDVGMNIVLKDSARDQLAFTLRPYAIAEIPHNDEGEVGTSVGGDAVGMQIGKKRQMEYTAQYDRTGRDLSNQFSIFYDAFDFASTAELPLWFSTPSLQAPIDEERLRLNTSQAYSIDHISKGRNGAENSFSVSYNRNVIRQHTQNESQYFLNGLSPTETTEDRQMLLRQDAFSLSYNHKINSDSHYGNIVFKGSASQNDGLSKYSTGTNQRIRTPQLNLVAGIDQTYTLKRSILQWKSTIDYHYGKDKMRTTDSNKSIQHPLHSEGLGDALIHTAHSLSWNRSFAHWHRNYGVSLEAENLHVAGENNTLLQAGVSPSWVYKDEDWHISFAPGTNIKRYTHQNATLLLPMGSIYINRDYGNRAKWNFSTSYSESTSSWSTLAVDHRQTDYRSWINAPDFVPRMRMLMSSFGYNYKRAIYQFFSNVRVSYSRTWNNAAMDMVITDGEYHNVWTQHDTHSDNYSGSINASKGWHKLYLKTNLTLSANYSNGQQYSGGESVQFKYVSYGVQPEIVFSPSWMEIDYKGEFAFNRNKTGEVWTKTLADWTQRLTLTSSISHVDLSLSGILYHNEIDGSPPVNTLLADAKVVWRMKRLRLTASLRNIFNKTKYAETTYSGIGIFTNRYWLRPRELMVTAQFSL